MLNRAIKQKDALTALFPTTETARKKSKKNESDFERVTEEDWKIVGELVDILKPFESATKTSSGQNYVTLSSQPMIFSDMRKNLDLKKRRFTLSLQKLNDPTYNAKEALLSEEAYQTLLEACEDGIEKLKKYADLASELGVLAIFFNPTFGPAYCTQVLKKPLSELEEMVKKYCDYHFNENESSESESSDNENSGWDTSYNSGIDWINLQKKINQSKSSECAIEKEIKKYHSEGWRRVENPLEFWKVQAAAYPILSTMAKDYLSIPSSSVASESAFSKARNLITYQRNSLSTVTVRASICLKSWLDEGFVILCED